MREIELKPSRGLGVLVLGVAMLAQLAVVLAALPWAIKLALGLAVIGFSVWCWRRASPPPRLRIAADGRLQVLDGQGAWLDAEVLGDSFVSTALIVLRYRMAGHPVRSLTLLPDSGATDDLRRLRVLLRWAPRTRSDTSSPDAG